MTIYRIYTRTINENCYDLELTLPVEMGEAGPRLTDRMIRQAATDETLNLLEARIVGAMEEGPEEIREIYRDNKIIWPTQHRKRAPKIIKQDPFIDDDGTVTPIATFEA